MSESSNEKNRHIPLSLCLIARNAADELQHCLEGIGNAVDEVLLLDTGSTDATKKTAEKLGACVFSFHWDQHFGKARNYILEKARNDWVLWIDTDEYYPLELINEIAAIVGTNSNFVGYYFPRRNYYFGKWLRYGGNYPDYQLKLYRKSAAEPFSDRLHEKVKIDGRIGYLSNYCEHYSNPTIDRFLRKFQTYTTIEAQILLEKGVSISAANTIKWVLVKPPFRFIKRYILKGGFLNGMPGLIAAVFDSLGYMVRYAKLWEMRKNRKQ